MRGEISVLGFVGVVFSEVLFFSLFHFFGNEALQVLKPFGEIVDGTCFGLGATTINSRIGQFVRSS